MSSCQSSSKKRFQCFPPLPVLCVSVSNPASDEGRPAASSINRNLFLGVHTHTLWLQIYYSTLLLFYHIRQSTCLCFQILPLFHFTQRWDHFPPHVSWWYWAVLSLVILSNKYFTPFCRLSFPPRSFLEIKKNLLHFFESCPPLKCLRNILMGHRCALNPRDNSYSWWVRPTQPGVW